MPLTRREVLCHAATASAGTGLIQRCVWAQAKDQPRPVEVKTAYGRVRGLDTGGLVTFKGIPYAGPVSGTNRFKAAPALKSWTGVRNAAELGPPSIQPGQRRNEPA